MVIMDDIIKIIKEESLESIFTLKGLIKIKKMAEKSNLKNIQDLVDDILNALESKDTKNYLLSSIELLRGCLQSGDEYCIILSTAFAIWSLNKAFKKKLIFSKYLGFSPNLDIIFDGVLYLFERDKKLARGILIPILKSIRGIILTTELASSPGFLGILLLAEILRDNAVAYTQLFDAYANTERDKIRLKKVLNLILDYIIAGIDRLGLPAFVNVLHGLKEILPDEEILPIFYRTLEKAKEIEFYGKTNDLVKLTKTLIEAEIVTGEEISEEIKRKIAKVCKICEEMLYSCSIRDVPEDVRSDIIFILALRGCEITSLLDSEFDAIDLILNADKFIMKYRNLSKKPTISLASSIAKATLKFWDSMDDYIISIAHRVFILASLMHDKSLPLKFIRFYKKALDRVKNINEEFYYASLLFLIRSIGYTSDLKVIEKALEEISGYDGVKWYALRKLGEIKVDLLIGNFLGASTKIKELLEMIEELDLVTNCAFKIEISKIALEMNDLKTAIDTLENLVCEAESPIIKSLVRDFEVNRNAILVEAYLRVGDAKRAEKLVENIEDSVKELDDPFIRTDAKADIFAGRARILLIKGEYEKALEYADEAIILKERIGKRDYEYMLIKAEALLKLGRKDEAKFILEEVYRDSYNEWTRNHALLNLFIISPDEYEKSLKEMIKRFSESQKINLIAHTIIRILKGIIREEDVFLRLCDIIDLISASRKYMVKNIRRSIEGFLRKAKDVCRGL